MLVEDYLRPAAVKVGVLKEGEKMRFRYHTLRHSLASSLVRKGTDVKTVQRLLRHSDDSTTLAIYAHSMSEDRLAAQGDMLKAMMKPPSDAVNWAATGESGVKSRTALFDRRLPQRLPNIYANLLNGIVPIAEPIPLWRVGLCSACPIRRPGGNHYGTGLLKPSDKLPPLPAVSPPFAH